MRRREAGIYSEPLGYSCAWDGGRKTGYRVSIALSLACVKCVSRGYRLYRKVCVMYWEAENEFWRVVRAACIYSCEYNIIWKM